MNQITDDGQLRELCKNLHSRLSDSFRVKAELQPPRYHNNMQRANAYNDASGFGPRPMGYSCLAYATHWLPCLCRAHWLPCLCHAHWLPCLCHARWLTIIRACTLFDARSHWHKGAFAGAVTAALEAVDCGVGCKFVVRDCNCMLWPQNLWHRYGVGVSGGGAPGYGGRGGGGARKKDTTQKKAKAPRKYVNVWVRLREGACRCLCKVHTMPCGVQHTRMLARTHALSGIHRDAFPCVQSAFDLNAKPTSAAQTALRVNCAEERTSWDRIRLVAAAGWRELRRCLAVPMDKAQAKWSGGWCFG